VTDTDLCSLRWDATAGAPAIIDQTLLPHTLRWCHLHSLQDYCHAISSMQVRGAPLIGVTAAYGLARALAIDPSTASLEHATAALAATRPTAVNLQWALEQVTRAVLGLPPGERAAAALTCAEGLREADIAACARIGEHGLGLLRQLPVDGPINIMTHCNAGWLATIRWGTALAPVYKAHGEGIPVHVWVSETRPRNQGASLTAWELQRAGVPCTVVADNSCAELMRRGLVDGVLVGSDRTAANGDVCNKVGTALKAMAAARYGIPFYVALPLSSIDPHCARGENIPIEERDPLEVLTATGRDAANQSQEINLTSEGTRAFNPAFDITPADLVTALVTEAGVVAANEGEIATLFR
jgi:methylthioribose-1-phosphate isomerase